jgi:hypothetical protein
VRPCRRPHDRLSKMCACPSAKAGTPVPSEKEQGSQWPGKGGYNFRAGLVARESDSLQILSKPGSPRPRGRAGVTVL